MTLIPLPRRRPAAPAPEPEPTVADVLAVALRIERRLNELALRLDHVDAVLAEVRADLADLKGC